MGFVNNIEYKVQPLPKGATCKLFCTKDLDFGCLFYEVSENGRLLRDNEDGSFTDMNFTGKLYVNCQDKEYNAYWFTFNETGSLSDVSLAVY